MGSVLVIILLTSELLQTKCISAEVWPYWASDTVDTATPCLITADLEGTWQQSPSFTISEPSVEQRGQFQWLYFRMK